MTLRTGAVVMALLASVVAPRAQSSLARRITADAVITGSPRLRDGSHRLVGQAPICGVIPKEASLTGVANFVIEVSGEISGTMTTITFGSKELIDRVDRTGSFRLTVGVRGAPHYVLNTDPPRNGNVGEATISTVKGVTTLKVVGQNEANERIELNVTCQ